MQCEGETRFRRLCQPFLYSHSSSNVLEVEVLTPGFCGFSLAFDDMPCHYDLEFILGDFFK